MCGLLGLLHGSIALAIAGVWPRPGIVLGLSLAIAIAGFAVSALFPVSATLKPLADRSPWNWALAGDPLVNTTAAWRYVALGLPSLALAAVGVVAFGRRDVRAA